MELLLADVSLVPPWRRVFGWLTAWVAFLCVATYVMGVLKVLGVPNRFTRYLDADMKTNLPTGWKIFALSTAAGLLWLVGKATRDRDRGFARHWRGLAAVLAFLAVDELCQIHQALGTAIERSVRLDGIFHYAWVIVYVPLALALLVAYVPFFRHLPATTRWQFLLAGVLFGGGSGGFELAKGALADSSGTETYAYVLTAATSDSAEMVGQLLFLYALIQYLAGACAQVRFVLPTTSDRVSGPHRLTSATEEARRH